MEVCILYKFKHFPSLIVIMEMDTELVIHIPESFDPSVFSGCYDPPGFRKFRLTSSDIFRVIQFVISPVFQSTVCVDP